MAEEQKQPGAQKKEEGKKVRRPSALKRDIQGERRALRNRSFKSRANTVLRSFNDAVSKGDAAAVNSSLSALYKIMDKGVKSGIFKQNKAARIKSRSTKRASKG